MTMIVLVPTGHALIHPIFTTSSRRIGMATTNNIITAAMSTTYTSSKGRSNGRTFFSWFSPAKNVHLPAFQSSSPSPSTTTILSMSTITNTRGGSSEEPTTTPTPTSNDNNNNPLLSSWTKQPYHMPPFDKIQVHHYKPALIEGMKYEIQDLQTIIDNQETPTFENVIAAYDRAGSILNKVRNVYSNMCSSLNPTELQSIQMEMSSILSKHTSQCMTLPGLFTKINIIYQQRHDLNLSSEQIRLIERIYLDFVRAGALFTNDEQEEYASIKAQLASLTTQFTQNVMKDEELYELILTLEDMDGCPESLIEATKQVANERNKASNEYVMTLSRSLVEPFLTYSNRRDLRQIIFEAWTKRGELQLDSSENNNLQIATQILRLRQRIAQLHGYKSFAEFQCVDRMAKTPQAVHELLSNVWERAKIAANRERQALEDYIANNSEETLKDGIQPWDWRYYAEKVRQAKYDFDESLLKPYLSLEQMTNALMAVSYNLYGLTYKERPDIVTYHPDVKVYEVRESLNEDTDEDKLVSIFIHDNFARKFKSSGAWMSEYRTQTKNLPEDTAAMEGIPIVSNNNNFAKSESTTLLSFDDAKTLFHEAGHGHHGMLSNCTYKRLASTNVVTDFVELPSQLMEHWLHEREVLKQYALHYQTGEPVPDELLDRLEAAQKFNQGFATIEYTICAMFDMALHELEEYPDDFDLAAFEKQELEKLGMPQGIVMRHRPAHFQHLFSTK